MSDKAVAIDYHAGDGRPLDFLLYDEDPLDPGEPDLTKPVDLSAATAIRFAVADAVTDTPHFTKALTDVITVLTGPEAVDNRVRVPMLKADTKDLTPGRKYYELEVTEAGDDWTGPHGLFDLHASLLR
ncbi:MAG TPA: hypothetical protein ENH55_16755 [Aurantimonas coralicida]|uniref:Uncharacterized protein n=1 Tax=marine sediment metagenome TaxID=412755 RepID=A0A0F9TD41_9ZZZZ|nr:hypothetical protein [Aurantimonas coralicida]